MFFMMKGYFVYRFLNEDGKVVYVGRTESLTARLQSHFSKTGGHLKKEQYSCVRKIDYIELKTRTDMKIKELYYIAKYKPAFNKIDKLDDVTLKIKEDTWKTMVEGNTKQIHDKISGVGLESINGELSTKQVVNFLNEQKLPEIKEVTQKFDRESVMQLIKDGKISSVVKNGEVEVDRNSLNEYIRKRKALEKMSYSELKEYCKKTEAKVKKLKAKYGEIK